MAKKKLMVPFDQDGNQLSYPWHGCQELPNFAFKATIKYTSYSRGRSSLNITWTNVDTDVTYESSMKFLDDIFREFPGLVLSNNQGIYIQGKFTFCKRGTSTLLTYIKPE